MKLGDIEDAVYYTKPVLYEWTDKEFDDTKALLVAQQLRYDFKFVVALCIYNEEQFLSDALQSCDNFVDLDGVHILDGAWVHGGDHPRSTDNSHIIINNYIKSHPDIKVTLEYNKLWRTEGEKRNAQLKRIEEIYGSAYIMVLDGDEVIKTNSGQTRHWMKHELNGHVQMIGVLKAFARGSKAFLKTPRLIPTKYGHHYHTECPMIIHNKNCELIIDYEWNHSKRNNDYLFDFDNFRLINNLNIRGHDRMVQKQEYVDKTFGKEYGECKWTT